MNPQPPAKTVQDLPLTNEQIAGELDEVADLLEGHGANPFRVRAYRNAAESIRKLEVSIVQLAEDQGVDGLMQLPAIGRSLANTLAHLADSGRLPMLERLRGENAPERLFTTVADIGPKLAQRIHEELGIETLSELSAAAHDGRLARVRGMGGKRVQAVREALAGRFRQASSADATPVRHDPEPASHRRSKNCWMLIASTVNWPSRASCLASLRAASIPPATPGCPSCTPTRRPPLHGLVLQHRTGSRTGHHARLGGHLL